MTFKLTLIRGLPGSGKSTLAKSLDINHYEADMYFLDPEGVYNFQPSKIALAHEWCQTMTEKSLSQKQSVVVSNTFVRRWEIAPYFKMAKRYGAEFHVIECDGNFGNVHGVQPATIEQMKQRWQTWQ